MNKLLIFILIILFLTFVPLGPIDYSSELSGLFIFLGEFQVIFEESLQESSDVFPPQKNTANEFPEGSLHQTKRAGIFNRLYIYIYIYIERERERCTYIGLEC